jgi:hypothetical protein
MRKEAALFSFKVPFTEFTQRTRREYELHVPDKVSFSWV